MNERDSAILEAGALSAARVFLRWLADPKRFRAGTFELSSDDEADLVQKLTQWAEARHGH